MKKLILLLFIPLLSIGQDYRAYIADKSYPSTKFYKLEGDKQDINLSFVKTEIGFAVLLKTHYYFNPHIEDVLIRKKLSLFLSNGDVINSEKTSANDYEDESLISLYPITETDIAKLIVHNLNRVRYTISVTDKFVSASKDINRTATTNDTTIDAALEKLLGDEEDVKRLVDKLNY